MTNNNDLLCTEPEIASKKEYQVSDSKYEEPVSQKVSKIANEKKHKNLIAECYNYRKKYAK